MACPLPDSVSKCLAQPVYNVGGSDYIALQVCDNNGQLLAVYELCSGVLSGAPTYYDLSGNAYTPSGTPRSCEAGDFEQFVFCDTDTDPPTPFISRVRWDENGDLVPEATGTFALDGLTPFTPVGPITVCGGDVVDAELVGPLCEKDATGNIVGNAWHKIFYRGQAQISTALVGYKLATPSTWLDPYVVGAGNALSICSSSTSAPALDTILVCGVVGGVSKPLIRRETIDADGNVDESFVDTDGVDEIPTSWTPGPCVNHLTSTIERVTGAGTVTIAANARSITVSVSAGNPTVQIGSDPAVALIPNLSLTWGTDSREEDLADVFTFTGLTGDDFFVTTSRL